MGKPDLTVARSVIWMQEIPLLGSGKTDYVTLESVDFAEPAANEPGEPLPPVDRDARGRVPS
jgi:hypothetical protein